jgi:hypothetical protein
MIVSSGQKACIDVRNSCIRGPFSSKSHMYVVYMFPNVKPLFQV